MQQVAEPVDDGNGGLVRHLDRGLMREGANHYEVDGAREVARHILDRFALADPDVAGREVNRVAAQLRHPGFEGDARTQRGLLENHRESFAAQMRMLEADFQFGLQAAPQARAAREIRRC